MNDNGVNYIVCGWYTPNYAHWAETLRASLDVVGERHDLVEVQPVAGGWERQTLRKPDQIYQAMLRHPLRTVIHLDVDCIVVRPLGKLAATRGDIALHLVQGRRTRGYGRLFGRTGTMVLKPNPTTYAFMANWANLSRSASHGQVDQHTLTEAIAKTPGLVVEHLDVKWCAMAKDSVKNPVILHDGASRNMPKVAAWKRSACEWIAATGWRTA